LDLFGVVLDYFQKVMDVFLIVLDFFQGVMDYYTLSSINHELKSPTPMNWALKIGY